MANKQRKCIKCNKVLGAKDTFCTNCGEKVVDVPSVEGVEVYICPLCKRKLPPGNSFCVSCNQSVEVSTAQINNTDITCNKCGTILKVTDEFCTGCGQKKTLIVKPTPTKAPTGLVDPAIAALPSASEGKPLKAIDIYGYNMTEDQMVDGIIKREIEKNGEKANISTLAIEKKKNIFTIAYSIILLICLTLFFFHTKRFLLFVVFVIVSIIYFYSVRKYDLLKYLQKEVKSRPDEKIGYIVSTVLAGKINNGKYKLIRLAFVIIAIVIPAIIFKAPHVIYERQGDEYVVRFYTVGWLKNDTELEIPEEYKGKPVVGIRGEVFANVKTLRKVVLPDTIKEIRGQAFQYASNLEEINIPEGIPEIKGETFEGCSSLKEITIPDSVTRIGGHAFRENYNLEKVNISANSKLKEIGSSAFRDCYELEEIYLPAGVDVDIKAFKGSGTNVKEYTSDGIVLEDKYEYENFFYLQVGETELINEFRSNAKTQGYSVRLDEVEGSYGDYSFVITIFKDDGGTTTFSLFRGSEYKIIDDYGIAVEIDDDYIFNSYSNSVSLNIYYN